MDAPTQLNDRGLVGPVLIILIGVIFLLQQFLPEFSFSKVWPLLLIAAGVASLLSRRTQ